MGPVPFSDLRIKAIDGGLNPRLDMAWTQGMTEWKPTGEIDGLFDRKNAEEEPKETLAPTADPYKPPQEESVANQMAAEGEWPGARRRSYIFAILILPFAWNFIIAWSSVMMKEQFGAEVTSMIVLGALFVPFLAWIIYSVKRLVNLGMSGWWFFGNFVPFLNIWLGYRCFACPGGYAYHKKLDGAGIALAILYWLSLLAVVAMIGLLIAAVFGAFGPEFKDAFWKAFNAEMAKQGK